jgi:hypothetical protein
MKGVDIRQFPVCVRHGHAKNALHVTNAHLVKRTEHSVSPALIDEAIAKYTLQKISGDICKVTSQEDWKTWVSYTQCINEPSRRLDAWCAVD